MSLIRKLALLIALTVGAGVPGFAATVSGTFTTNVGSGAISDALFVRAGERARVQILNTFVGTVQIQMSRDGGTNYSLVRSTTTTLTVELAARTQDVRYRLVMTAYTSGTVTYALDNMTPSTGRVRYSTVPIGSVAYGSFGSVLNPPVAGTLYVADVVVSKAMTVTGLAVLNGATCGTDAYVLWLFDSTGKAIGNTSLSGTTCSGTDAFQQIALASSVPITAGQYFIGVRTNGTTDRTRFIAANTFVDPVTSATAHSSLLVGSFGSSIYGIPVPSTFTAGQGPIAYLYGTN